MTTEIVVHGKIDLALHHLRPPTSDTGTTATRPLLLLHGLGEASPAVGDARPAAHPIEPYTGSL